jgi:hypothetical protein
MTQKMVQILMKATLHAEMKYYLFIYLFYLFIHTYTVESSQGLALSAGSLVKL